MPTAIILAAGHGTRMGGPKALLRVGGESLVALHVARFAEVGCPSLIVTRPELIAAMPSARVIGADTRSQAESLQVALAEVQDALVFITPVDLLPPLAGTLQALLRALTHDYDAVTPQYGAHGGHPVLARRAIFDPTLLSLRDRLTHVRRLRLPVDDPTVALDFDTPSQLAEAGVTWRLE
jgi:molybdenum cofactor cytidylyltransferase